MAGEGGESHSKVVIVAGPGGTKGNTSQDLEHFGRLYKSQTLLIMINSDQCGVCFFSSTMFSHFLNMPRNCRPDFTTHLTFERLYSYGQFTQTRGWGSAFLARFPWPEGDGQLLSGNFKGFHGLAPNCLYIFIFSCFPLPSIFQPLWISHSSWNTSFVHSFNKYGAPATCQALLKAMGYNHSKHYKVPALVELIY